jgi:excisionase family DNA binding protein
MNQTGTAKHTGETRLLKIGEVAERLAIGRSLAYGLVSSGAIRSVRVTERAVRVSEEDLAAFITRRREL